MVRFIAPYMLLISRMLGNTKSKNMEYFYEEAFTR